MKLPYSLPLLAAACAVSFPSVAQSPVWRTDLDLPADATQLEAITSATDATATVTVANADRTSRYALTLDGLTGEVLSTAPLPGFCPGFGAVAGETVLVPNAEAYAEGFTIGIAFVSEDCDGEVDYSVGYGVDLGEGVTAEEIVIGEPFVDPVTGYVYVHGLARTGPQSSETPYRPFVFELDAGPGEVLRSYVAEEPFLSNPATPRYIPGVRGGRVALYTAVTGDDDRVDLVDLSEASPSFSSLTTLRGGASWDEVRVNAADELAALSRSASGQYGASPQYFGANEALRERTPFSTPERKAAAFDVQLGDGGALLVRGQVYIGDIDRGPAPARVADLASLYAADGAREDWVGAATDSLRDARVIDDAERAAAYGAGVTAAGQAFVFRLAAGTVSIGEFGRGASVKVFPNPTQGGQGLTIEAGDASVAGEAYQVLDVMGRTVAVGRVGVGGGVATGGLPKGVYVVALPGLGARAMVVAK